MISPAAEKLMLVDAMVRLLFSGAVHDEGLASILTAMATAPGGAGDRLSEYWAAPRIAFIAATASSCRVTARSLCTDGSSTTTTGIPVRIRCIGCVGAFSAGQALGE